MSALLLRDLPDLSVSIEVGKILGCLSDCLKLERLASRLIVCLLRVACFGNEATSKLAAGYDV